MDQYEYSFTNSDDDDLLAIYLDQSQRPQVEQEKEQNEEVHFQIEKEKEKGTSVDLLLSENDKSFYDFLVEYTSLVVDRNKFKQQYFNVEINESLIKRRNNLTSWKSTLMDVQPLSILLQAKEHTNTAVPLPILLLNSVGAVRMRDLKGKKSMSSNMKDAIWESITIQLFWCHATLPDVQFKRIEALLTGILIYLINFS